MKRNFLVFAAILLLVTRIGFAQSLIDKTVATVKLSKMEPISATQFNQEIEFYETLSRRTLSMDERRKLLESMIDEKLITQAASMENITVNQAEIESVLAPERQKLALMNNWNQPATEQQLKLFYEQQGVSWDRYLKNLRITLLTQKLVDKKKKALFEKMAPPTESEIEDVYDTNKTRLFTVNDTVRFKHIYIDTSNLSSSEEKAKARERAEEIARELRNGAAFDDLVVRYSDDTASRYKGGDFGYLLRDDQRSRQRLGKEFFDALFKMDVGEVSGVLESNMGFHIIRVTEKIPARLLALDDPLSPQNNTTVRDYISAELMNQQRAELYNQALQDLLSDLKKKAEIKRFEENLPW